MGMAKPKPLSAGKGRKTERMLYGVIIAALAALWLIAATGAIKTDFPFGPVLAIIIGLAFILIEARKD